MESKSIAVAKPFPAMILVIADVNVVFHDQHAQELQQIGVLLPLIVLLPSF